MSEVVKATIDLENGVGYIQVKPDVEELVLVRSVPDKSEVVFDIDETGEVYGVEFIFHLPDELPPE